MDFKALVTAQLNSNNAESQLKDLCKDRNVNLKVNLTGDVDFKSIQKQLNSISKQSIKLNTDKSTINQAKSDFQMLKNLANEISQKKIKLAGLDDGKNINQIKELRTQIEHLESDYKTLNKAFQSSLNEKQIGHFEQMFGRTSDKISEIAAKAKDLKSIPSAISKIDEASSKLKELQNIDTSKFENASAYQKMTNYIKDAENAMIRFNAEKEKGENANFDVLTKEMKEVESATKKAETQYKNLYTQINKLDGITASNKASSWLSNNDMVYKDKHLSSAIENIADQLKNVTYQGELDSLQKELNNYIAQAQASGLSGKSGISMFKQSFAAIAQFTGIYGVLQNVVEEIPRQMVQAVYDVDTAMTSLYKVTDETDARYEEFLTNASTKSQELGRTISSLVEQTAEWSKLGFTLSQAEELSKVSSIYANVGEVDDATAVSHIVTAIKAYNIEASNAMDIVDSYNELGNTFATDAASLGDGISKAASSLAVAGNDFDQSLAMLTGMAEITQNASESGNALKILSMRLRGYNEETESYSNDVEELSGTIADLTKTASTPGGISLFTDETKQTYKSTFQLMEEISKIYDDLTDKDQAALLEAVAGKQRGNQIAALIQAFQSGQIQKALTKSQESEGSAYEEQMRSMESLEKKTQQFQAAFQNLSNVILKSDLLKGLVDSGTVFLNILTQIIDKFGILVPILTGVGIRKFVKNFD